MTVAQVGEFPLIERLAAILGPTRGSRSILGIGDDAAAWEPTPNAITVATADALVEGVHFDRATTSWRDLGWKTMAENVSDIAAMGCRPTYALLTLAIPGDTATIDLEELYRGIADCAQAYAFDLIGGDVVRAPTVTLSVTLIGESQPRTGPHPSLLVRSAARAGDVVAVTGPLGGSGAGLRVLLDNPALRTRPPEDTTDEAVLAATHCRPMPRVAAGLALVEAGVRCAQDISDGLVADLGHICERSRVDAEITAESIPVPDAAVRVFGTEAALQLALTGGEDYELVCTAPTATIIAANASLAARSEPPLAIIGRIVGQVGSAPSVRVFQVDGTTYPIGQRGYQHFTV